MKIQLYKQPELTLEDLDLPDYLETSVSSIEKIAKQICAGDKEGEPTEVSVRFNEKEDSIEFIVKKARRIRMNFKQAEGGIISHEVTFQVYTEIMDDLDKTDRTLLRIDGSIYQFTKFQYQGMRELKPQIISSKCVISAEEVQRRSDNLARIAEMGKARMGVDLIEGARDNDAQEAKKRAELEKDEI